MRPLTLTIILIGFIISCTDKSALKDDDVQLGEITLDVSGNEKARPYFEEGLLLLHSFEFKDAAENFRKAQELDSSFAMAYWGEAMTENHPLWREQEYDKAIAILAKLGETKEEQREAFKTPLEKDFYDAISTLYGEGSKEERDKSYAAVMDKLHKKYPDNHEITAFYALSLLGSAGGKRDYDTYGKAARIAQSVIAENPNHPGALHYLIHSYDDPDHAPQALTAANSYAKVAPEANHALHMPSHIYVALGMWDEVISSNIAAFSASQKRKKRKDLDNDALDYHSLKWLMYGYLQTEDFDKARELVKDMERYASENPTPKSLGHTVMMKAAYFTETEEWEDALLQDSLDYSDLSVQLYASHQFMLGRQAAHQKDMDQLNNHIQFIQQKIKESSNEIAAGEPTMCSGSYSRRRPTKAHIERATVMKKQLETLKAIADGNSTLAENLMKEAMDMEEKITYSYGPPEIIKPSPEFYAEWLEQQDRHDEAKRLYEKVLDRAPKRFIALQGMERVNKEMGT